MKASSAAALAVLALCAVSAFAQDATATTPRKMMPEKPLEAGQRQNGGDSGPGSWQFYNPAKANEAGQRAEVANGGDSGPNSWQFWGPQRQLLQAGGEQKAVPNTPSPAKKSVNERGGRSGGRSGAGGFAGPNSWQFYQAQRQLLATGTDMKEAPKKAVNEAGQNINGGQAGPNSWQFWKPTRQLLQVEAATKKAAVAVAAPVKKATEAAKKPVAAAAPVKKAEAAPKKPVAAAAPVKKAEAAPKKPVAAAAAPKKVPEAAPGKQQPAAPAPAPVKKAVPERGFGARSTGWGGWWSGGTAYPLQNGNTIFTTAGWGGGKPAALVLAWPTLA